MSDDEFRAPTAIELGLAEDNHRLRSALRISRGLLGEVRAGSPPNAESLQLAEDIIASALAASSPPPATTKEPKVIAPPKVNPTGNWWRDCTCETEWSFGRRCPAHGKTVVVTALPPPPATKEET